MTEIAGSRVVILGGTAGTGLAMARLFAANGARLVLMGRNPQKGADACIAVQGHAPGAEVGFVQVDATNADDAAAAVGHTPTSDCFRHTKRERKLAGSTSRCWRKWPH